MKSNILQNLKGYKEAEELAARTLEKDEAERQRAMDEGRNVGKELEEITNYNYHEIELCRFVPDEEMDYAQSKSRIYRIGFRRHLHPREICEMLRDYAHGKLPKRYNILIEAMNAGRKIWTNVSIKYDSSSNKITIVENNNLDVFTEKPVEDADTEKTNIHILEGGGKEFNDYWYGNSTYNKDSLPILSNVENNEKLGHVVFRELNDDSCLMHFCFSIEEKGHSLFARKKKSDLEPKPLARCPGCTKIAVNLEDSTCHNCGTII